MASSHAALLKKYITVLVHEGGSDIHFSTEAHPTIRVSGSLAPLLKEPVLTAEDTLGFAEEHTSELQSLA
jgi:Tfp pilus assembly ATPase PilU